MYNLRFSTRFLFIFILLVIPFANVYAAPTYEPRATASEVIVIYNTAYSTDADSDTVQDSLELANYYKTKRTIPVGNVIGVSAPLTEVITRAQFDTLKSTIESAITGAGLTDSAKYVVLMKGIPLKVTDTVDADNNDIDKPYNINENYSSVDSGLVFLYQTYSTDGQIVNPYYNADSSYTLDYRFNTDHFTGTGVTVKYLVTRLDGYTVANVKGMIDRAYSADTTGDGYFVLDKFNSHGFHLDSMDQAATLLSSIGANFHPDPMAIGVSAITSAPGSVIGYAGYGTYADLGIDYYNNELSGFTYLNGAIASTYESYNAYTMSAAPGSAPYKNHGQLGEFIAAGGSGGIGNVYEPFSFGISNESIWSASYAKGYDFADAAYMSLSKLDWTSVLLGDPLMHIVTNSSVPTLTTSTATGITATTGVLNGSIATTGGENPMTRGFNYGLTSGYGSTTVSHGDFSTGIFSASLSALTCGTTYHYQSYAVNSAGTGTSSPDATFTTDDCGTTMYFYPNGNSNWTNVNNWWTDELHTVAAGSLPTSTSQTIIVGSTKPSVDLDAWVEPASIDATSSGINFTHDGNFNINSDITGDVIFSGDIYSFGTIVGDVTYSGTSNNNGTITGDVIFNNSGGNSNTGIINGTAEFNGSGHNDYIINGSATFRSQSSNAWYIYGDASFYDSASNTANVYGDICLATTAVNSGVVTGAITVCSSSLGSVTTDSFSPVDVDYASLLGTVTSTGGESMNERGFQYGLTTSYGDTVSETGVFIAEEFGFNVFDLVSGTPYHFRSFATNSAGTVYGEDKLFSSIGHPNVSNSSVTNITKVSATLNASIDLTGGDDVTERGFNYGLTNSYGINVSETAGSPFSAGAFSIDISSLNCGTTYHYLSYAINSYDTNSSSDSTFKTSACSNGNGFNPSHSTVPIIKTFTIFGSNILVKLGSSGASASGVQNAINQMNIVSPLLLVDGKIGNKSVLGIKMAQKILNTTQDGFWGKNTQALYEIWVKSNT